MIRCGKCADCAEGEGSGWGGEFVPLERLWVGEGEGWWGREGERAEARQAYLFFAAISRRRKESIASSSISFPSASSVLSSFSSSSLSLSREGQTPQNPRSLSLPHRFAHFVARMIRCGKCADCAEGEGSGGGEFVPLERLWVGEAEGGV
jgi:hypothetical protein